MRALKPLLPLFLSILASAACASQPRRAPPTYLPVACDDPNAGPSTPLVYLEVRSEHHSQLQRMANGAWCTMCLAPCNGYVPASGVYRMTLGDSEDSATKEFSMPNAQSAALIVDADGNILTRHIPWRRKK